MAISKVHKCIIKNLYLNYINVASFIGITEALTVEDQSILTNGILQQYINYH